MPAFDEHALSETLIDRLRGMHRGSVVLLLGDVDTGKSTLTRHIVGHAGLENIGVVDTDVGQGELAPPASMGAALFVPGGVTPVGSKFIGAVTPVRHTRDICDGAQHLSNLVRRRDPDLILIDTCGLVRGWAGVGFKTRLIQTVKPDIVLAVSRSGELDLILNQITPPGSTSSTRAAILPISPSADVRRKSPVHRRRRRQERFAVALDGAKNVTWRIVPDDIRFALPEGKSGGEVDLRRLLCGLEDTDGLCVGIGTLERVDWNARALTISTAVGSRPDVAAVRFGDLLIAPDGSTLGEVKTRVRTIRLTR